MKDFKKGYRVVFSEKAHIGNIAIKAFHKYPAVKVGTIIGIGQGNTSVRVKWDERKGQARTYHPDYIELANRPTQGERIAGK